MKISIATVCFNAENTIENTMLSVIGQTYKDIEYIIVDGASSDTTLDIIRRYEQNHKLTVISEPDNGLYDAMNKAADIATGEYILYMNSGDVFAKETVVEEIVPHLEELPPLLYGNVIRIKDENPHREVLETYRATSPMKLVLMGKMMSHQSIFTRCDIMKKYRFNTKFSITADYDLIVRLLRDKTEMKYAKVTVSKVENIEGISSSVENMDKMRKQDDESLKANFPGWYYLIYIPKALIRMVRRVQENKKK